MKTNTSICPARFLGLGLTPLFALLLALCIDPLSSRALVPATSSTDVVVVPISGTTYNISGPSAGIVCVGTSTITVYPGTTVGQVEAGLQSQDGSVQDWVEMDPSSTVLTGASVIASGDTLAVVAADGTDQYTYTYAVFNNPAEQGMPGGINPVTGWQEGNYWNEALYFNIDSTVNANRPIFPNNTFTITDPKYAALVTQITEGTGATAVSGVYYYGAAINQAIIDCNAAGGGKVVIPVGGSLNTNTMNAPAGGSINPGTPNQPNSLYYSGSINLLSNVNLYIAPGVHVAFVRNLTNAYYPCVPGTYQGQMMYNFASPIYALNQSNIALTGGGYTSCLDMQDHVSSWSLPTAASGATKGSNNTLNDEDYELIPLTGRINSDTGTVPALVPQVVGGWGSGLGYTMAPPPAGTVMGSGVANVHSGWQTPPLLEFIFCSNVYISGVEDYSPTFWNTHPFECTNVLIQHFTAYEESHMTDDGCDPESCSNMVMEDNNINAWDDCTAIKSGRNVEARWPMGDGFGGTIVRHACQNLINRNGSSYNQGGDSSGLGCGSENAGGAFNIFIENYTCGGSGIYQALKLKTTAWRNNVIVGGYYVRNFTVTALHEYGIMNLNVTYGGDVAYPNADVCNPTFRDVYMENVNTTPTVNTAYPPFLISASGSLPRCPQTNINYRNSTFNCSGASNTYSGPLSGFPAAPFYAGLNASNISMVNSTTGVTTVVNTTPINLLGAPTINVSNASVTLAADSEYNTGVPMNDSSNTWTGPYTFTTTEPVTPVPARTFVIKGQIDLSTYPTFATPKSSGGAGGVVQVYIDRSTTPIACTLTATGAFTSGAVTLVDSPEPYWYMGYHMIDVNMYDSTYLNINSYIYLVAYQQDTTSPTFVTLTASLSQLTVPADNTQLVTVTANVSDALDSAPVSAITGVAANQTINPGDVTINPSGTNPLQVGLTAYAGRVYTITVTTTDSWGNVSTATVSVIGYSVTKLPRLF